MQAPPSGIRTPRRGPGLTGSSGWCVGVDLAWSDRHPTAVCVVDPGGIVVAEHEVETDDEIMTVIKGASAVSVVAVDAPLLVPNVSGRRPCEAELQRVYGSRHAGAHPANRSLLERVHGRIRGEDLARRLRHQGFADPWAETGLTVLEVYPHPAIIEMFDLPQRLRYKAKRGMRVADRRAGLATLEALVASLAEADPTLVAPRLTVDASARGRRLKSVEDMLDARVCAWVGRLWATDRRAVRLFGDAESGHIAVPVRSALS